MKLFFDSNVIIDALTNREGAVEEARKLLYSATAGEIEGVVSAKQMTDVYYVLRRYIPEHSVRRDIISLLIEGFAILPVDKDVLQKALESVVPDYEDAVICACAEIASVDAIISNDKEVYKNGQIKAISPGEAVKQLGL